MLCLETSLTAHLLNGLPRLVLEREQLQQTSVQLEEVAEQQQPSRSHFRCGLLRVHARSDHLPAAVLRISNIEIDVINAASCLALRQSDPMSQDYDPARTSSDAF